jgi:peptidoglycan/LPS O-acetylase OafA/YrhL
VSSEVTRWPGIAGPVLADMLSRDKNSFGVMRLLLASAVVISHAFMVHAGTMAADPVLQWTGYTSGQHAVQGFFVLSGLLIAQSFAHSRVLIDFASARILRIFPGLFLCVLLTALILGPLISTFSPGRYFSSEILWLYIAETLSLKTGSAPLPGVFEHVPMANMVNWSLWTLKFETICYAALGLAGAAVLASPWPRHARLALAACVAAFLVYKQPQLIEGNSFVDTLRYFSLFFATGVLAYAMRRHIVINGLVLTGLAALFAVSIGTRFTEVTAAALLGYGMLWLSRFSFGPLRSFTSRHDLSYGIYIYGVPVTQTLQSIWPGLGIAGLVALSFAIVVPLAALSWLLVERPAMRLRPVMAGMLSESFKKRRIA